VITNAGVNAVQEPLWRGTGLVKVRDVSLFVRIDGHGYPLALMHGGPSADHVTMLPFEEIADRFTLVFYDHRCNGRSTGAPVTTMTWDNLTADADALRERLGFDRWAVLGHSFGGHVALEYALRYPDRVSHLLLMNTAAESRWSQENAARVMASRGYSPKRVELVRRWFNGEIEPNEYASTMIRIFPAYFHHLSPSMVVGAAFGGAWRSKVRPEALIFAGRHLLKGWTVMDRLHEIKAPTLVIAGRDDFVFPPEAQHQLAEGIPNSRLVLVDRAGHNPDVEQTATVMEAVRGFLPEAM
jgi:proline-specific peptidase